MKAHVRAQLGPLLHQHRPSALWRGWLFIIVISWWPMLGLVWSANEAPTWVLVVFSIGLFFPFVGAFGEWAFGVHRLYTHALVITASYPFARCRVIPLWTINPDTINVEYLALAKFQKDARNLGGDIAMEGPAQRAHPFARWILSFTGTSAYLARDHARGRMDLRDHSSQASATWVLADANNQAAAELHAQQLRDAITNEPPFTPGSGERSRRPGTTRPAAPSAGG